VIFMGRCFGHIDVFDLFVHFRTFGVPRVVSTLHFGGGVGREKVIVLILFI
jgi:hypothetical protein